MNLAVLRWNQYLRGGGYHHTQGLREPVHSDHAHKTPGDEDRVCSPGRRPCPRLVPTRGLTRVSACSGQRHFCVFAVSFPGQEALTSIYSTILTQHLSFRSAPLVVQRMSTHLVASALGKPSSLAPSPVRKTHCITGPTAASYFPLLNISFILSNQYFFSVMLYFYRGYYEIQLLERGGGG